MSKTLAVLTALVLMTAAYNCGSSSSEDTVPAEDVLDIPAAEIVNYEPVPLSKCQGSGFGSLTDETLQNLAQYDSECEGYNDECVEVTTQPSGGSNAFYCVLCGLYSGKMRCHMINPK